METINSQIGQTFAGNAVSRVSQQTDQASQRTNGSLQTARIAEEPSTDRQRNNVGADIQQNEVNTKPQGNANGADITNSEQRNTALEIEDATRQVEQFLQTQNRNLAFAVDESSQRSIVTVTAVDSGEVIRQIPSEEMLRLAERLEDLRTDVGSSVGILFNNQV